MEIAGPNPVHANDVQKAVRAIVKEEGVKPPSGGQKKAGKMKFYRLAAADLAAIRQQESRLRTQLAKLGEGKRLIAILDKMVALLPGSGGERFRLLADRCDHVKNRLGGCGLR
jgi:hypothetical protein